MPAHRRADNWLMGLNGLAPHGIESLSHGDTAVAAFVTVALFLIGGPAPALAQTPPVFNWIREVDNSGLAYSLFAGLGTDAQGNVYVAGSTQSPNFPVVSAVQNHLATAGSYDVFVTKFDPSGNIVYSTYFGGSADDIARAMTVDTAGNVYVTGGTASQDFPTTRGSWSPSPPPALPGSLAPGSAYEGGVFVFKLNPDGTLGYSTYFTSNSDPVMPQGIAVESAGSVYLTGTTYGGVPTTAGAYQTSCACGSGGGPGVGPPITVSDAFLARFDPTGSQLLFATYLGVPNANGNAVAVGPDGSAYVASPTGIYRLNAAGSSLLGTLGPVVNAQAMAVAPDGRVYLAGAAGTGQDQLQPTAGVYQTNFDLRPILPGQGAYDAPLAIAIVDAGLQNTLAATYFGDRSYGQLLKAMTLDSAGNVYLSGYTSPRGLATRTPLVEGFAGSLGTGFVSALSGDLSTLLFSSYFGDGEYFGVMGVGIGSNGSIALAGPTDHGTVWVNSVEPAALPALRIDAVENAASLLDGPIAAGETLVIRGSGFGSDAQLLVGGIAVPAISVTPNAIAATIPSNVASLVTVQVQSGETASNQVFLNVAATSPGLFSGDAAASAKAT